MDGAHRARRPRLRRSAETHSRLATLDQIGEAQVRAGRRRGAGAVGERAGWRRPARLRRRPARRAPPRGRTARRLAPAIRSAASVSGSGVLGCGKRHSNRSPSAADPLDLDGDLAIGRVAMPPAQPAPSRHAMPRAASSDCCVLVAADLARRVRRRSARDRRRWRPASCPRASVSAAGSGHSAEGRADQRIIGCTGTDLRRRDRHRRDDRSRQRRQARRQSPATAKPAAGDRAGHQPEQQGAASRRRRDQRRHQPARPARSAARFKRRRVPGAASALPDTHPLFRRRGTASGRAGRRTPDTRGRGCGRPRRAARRRVRIGQQPLAQIGLAIVAPPDLRPAEIEALVAGRAVDHRRLAGRRAKLCRRRRRSSTPARSPIFSPSVSSPLTLAPGKIS